VCREGRAGGLTASKSKRKRKRKRRFRLAVCVRAMGAVSCDTYTPHMYTQEGLHAGFGVESLAGC
jgi:hypothetical protein